MFSTMESTEKFVCSVPSLGIDIRAFHQNTQKNRITSHKSFVHIIGKTNLDWEQNEKTPSSSNSSENILSLNPKLSAEFTTRDKSARAGRKNNNI